MWKSTARFWRTLATNPSAANDERLRCLFILYLDNYIRHAHCIYKSCAQLVTQVNERRHVGDARIDIFPIVGALGTVNLKLVHDGRYVLDDTSSNLKNLKQNPSEHSFCRILDGAGVISWAKSSVTRETRDQGIHSDKNKLTCILCLSMTAAESSLIGRGVLFTTTRRIHCSNLQMTMPVRVFSTFSYCS